MKNEELLNELKQLFDTFNDEADEHDKEFEFWKGQVTEMQRHNGRTIKILGGIITALITVMGILIYVIQQLVGKIP